MEFNDAVRTGIQKYAKFSGRASRSEFWFWILFIVMANIGSLLLDRIIGYEFVNAVLMFALMLPTLAVTSRRMHDQNRSGGWTVLAFIPLGQFVLLYFAVQPGTEGLNRFGPDPLMEDEGAAPDDVLDNYS